LNETKDEKMQVGLRMADFADFALRAAAVVSDRETVQALLDRLVTQQVEFSTDDDALLVLLDRWLADDSRHVNVEREIAQATLAKELEAFGPCPWTPGQPKSFAQYLRPRREALRRLYGMTERKGHAGTKLLSFKHYRLSGDMGVMGDVEPATSSVTRQVEG
jgi:hypothetical protein